MSADPRWRLSGGAGNANPALSLGGAMSATEAGAGIFDDVSGADSAAGDTEYRGVYVTNVGDVDLVAPVVWIVDESDASADIEIAIADEGVGATMETIANENTAPAGPAFVEAPNKAGGLALPTIPAGSRCGVWIKRAVPAATPANAVAGFTLRVEGDTV